jgi:hypothetical protein
MGGTDDRSKVIAPSLGPVPIGSSAVPPRLREAQPLGVGEKAADSLDRQDVAVAA